MKDEGFKRLTAGLADQIRDKRLAIGLSQEALALAAGVDRTYVSQLERGVANPSLKILYLISTAMDAKLQIDFDAHWHK
jgi:transcriptional regulator with XRE-family HTH domain